MSYTISLDTMCSHFSDMNTCGRETSADRLKDKLCILLGNAKLIAVRNIKLHRKVFP